MPTTLWGLGFFLLVAACTLARFGLAPSYRGWVSGGRIAILLVGLAFAGGVGGRVLDGQLPSIGALVVAAGAVALLVTQALTFVFPPSSSGTLTMPTRLLKQQLALFVYLTAVAVVLVGADFTYFQSLDTSPQALQPVVPSTQVPSDTLPSGTQACGLDPQKDHLSDDGRSLVTFQDITKGPSGADVTIVEYFDPNCPHCRDFHNSTMSTLVKEYKDEVRFVYKPFPLRASSLPEIQALYVAHGQGAFTQMLEAQYSRQKRGGLTKRDLRAIASNIGMNPEMLISRIDANKHREQVVRQREKAVEIGVSSTPTVLVNGHFVGSRTLQCMETYIEQAQNGTLGTS
jgi:protein-disulfide isomerase